MSACLIAVVHGETYERYAEDLFASAREYFRPSELVELTFLEGRQGWPEATMYRWHVLLENLPRAKFVYLIDADMRFEDHVRSEVIPPRGLGIVATRHPGYVDRPRRSLPYERRQESAAHVGIREGGIYYCGGFVGGERLAMRMLAVRIAAIIDRDVSNGLIPAWHDESALNRALIDLPPATTLSPAYCHPDDDRAYLSTWPEFYARKIVALDKSPLERGER